MSTKLQHAKADIFKLGLSNGVQNLPEFQFRNDIAGFSTELSQLSNLIEIRLENELEDGATEKEIIEKVIDAYEEVSNDPEMTAHFSGIRNISNMLGDNIIETIRVLKNNFLEEADTIRDTIEGTVIEDIDNQDITDSDSEIVQVTPMDWDETTEMFGGPMELIAYFTEKNGIEPSITPYDLYYMRNQPPSNVWDTSLELPASGTTFEDIRSRLLAKCTPEQHEKALTLLDSLMDRYKFQYVLETPVLSCIDDANLLMKSMRKCQEVLSYQPVLEVFRKTPLDITSEMSDSWYARLDSAEMCLRYAALTTMYVRVEFKNSIVLDRNIINPDVVPSLESFGLTVEDIPAYIHSYHTSKDIVIPGRGINPELIQTYKDRAHDLFEQAKLDHEDKVSRLKDTATRKAMAATFTDYLQSTAPERLPTGMDISSFVSSKMGVVNLMCDLYGTTPDHNLESIICDFILSCHYDGTAIETAHRLYSEKMLNHIGGSTTVDENTLVMVDTSVAASLCAQYIKSQLIVR